jgi:transposase
MSDLFWLSEAQMRRLAPLLPSDTRGKPRVDDRRVISGIVHVLRSGGRWVDAPAVYGPRKTLYNRFVRWAAKGVWQRVFRALARAGGPPAELLLDSSHVKAHRSAGGGKGGSARKPSGGRGTHRGRPRWGPPRGGRTTKIHALTDHLGRPIGFELTAGQHGDAPVALALLAPWPSAKLCIADAAYDSNGIRSFLLARGILPVIPNNPTRKQHHPFDRSAWRKPNLIERVFCRLKDFRRIATRYDRRADVFLSAVYLAATVTWWL